MSKKHYCTIMVPQDLMDRINGYLEADGPDEYQDENETISMTAVFDDGMQADVKCCGCQDEPSWTEMVLFNERGGEVCCTEPSDMFDGRWTLTDSATGDEYVVTVIAAGEKDRFEIFTDGENYGLLHYTNKHANPQNVDERFVDAAKEYARITNCKDRPFTFADLLTRVPYGICYNVGFVLDEIDKDDPVVKMLVKTKVNPAFDLLRDVPVSGLKVTT